MSDELRETGLRFFGAMNASISHEIKNRMAIINEQAGLLEDLVRLAERGRALEPERLLKLSASVRSQISQANGIIGAMNRFAHTVDQSVIKTDLGELAALAAGLFARQAAGRNFSLLARGEGEVMVATAPFMLLNLLWLWVSSLLTTAAERREARLVWGRGQGGAWLGLEVDPPLENAEPPPGAHALAEALGAEAILEPEKGRLRLNLPARL